MSSLPFLKLFMLLTMNVMVVKALIPPNRAEPNSDKIETSTYGEKYMNLIRKFSMMPGATLPNILLCIVLLLTSLSPTISAEICPKDVNHELHRLSPTFLGIFFVVAAGTSARFLCYRTLGKFFTYEITIRPKHQIIDIGPYAVVRHASYTGLFTIVFGAEGFIFTSQSPAIMCGWTESSFFAIFLMGFWLLWGLSLSHWIMTRVQLEERNLRDHFGPEWEDYVKRVPYRFLPGIC